MSGVTDLASALTVADQRGEVLFTLFYRQTFFARGTGTIDGQEVPTAGLIIDRTIVNRGSTGIQYPFSTTRRFETDVGATLLTGTRSVDSRANFSSGERGGTYSFFEE
ncbi:MAG: hypothetical protein ACLFWG_07745 [Longimicrobiales bacterium]